MYSVLLLYVFISALHEYVQLGNLHVLLPLCMLCFPLAFLHVHYLSSPAFVSNHLIKDVSPFLPLENSSLSTR